MTLTVSNAHPTTGHGRSILPLVSNALSSMLRGRKTAHHANEASSLDPAVAKDLSELLHNVHSCVASVILGKDRQVRHAIGCFLAGGHLLIEDVPGVGKTTLSHALAMSLGLQFSRVQFTADLLPSDITGSSIYDRESQSFVFHEGPVFTQVLLADEINRANPKTQSALLEAMEENSVTIDGKTHALPHPFFVIATQNPSSQMGTFGLPESQLDRFLMRISLGYPDELSEKAMLAGNSPRQRMHQLQAALTDAQMQQLFDAVPLVSVSQALVDYAYRLIQATRNDPLFAQGLSPRASLAMLNASRALALFDGRNTVLPDDIQEVFPFVANHRLQINDRSQRASASGQDLESYWRQWMTKIPVEV